MQFKLSTKNINEIIGGELKGSPDLFINGINRLENAKSGDLIFCSSIDYEKSLDNCKASCIIIFENHTYMAAQDQALIVVSDPYRSFVEFLIYLDKIKNPFTPGIHDSAVIGSNCEISEDVEIRENVSIGNNCKIGANTKIYSNVSIYDDSVIGDNCIIHSGAVIGSDGFGYVQLPEGNYVKIPQLGNVIIGNNVEIGSNTCIDRSIAGSTIISDGVKIDNLCHIGHNVEIGDHSAFAAQVGLSGSMKIGKRVKMGGQVGSAGHISIVDDVTIIAQSGVSKSLTKKGTYFGSPAKPQRDAFRIEAALRNLPDLLQDVKELKNKK